MVRFVFKFLCVFYVTVIVNARSLPNTFENDKFSNVYGSRSRKHTTEHKNNYEGAVKVSDSQMDKILANGTEKVTHLKHMYGENKYRTFLPKLDKIIYEYNSPRYITHKSITKKMSTTIATTEDTDFLGTAQIEELLNDIKARAIQMVAEQNPAVTDIITNTVTEATFEADPILTHLEVSSPGFALTTFVFLNNIENIDKRTANESNVVLISNKKDKHNVSARSIKGDAFTIAQSVEDMLQKELKSVYKKVKNKVSKDFHKEVKQAKTTLKCKSTKMIDKVTKTITGGKKTHLTTKATTKFRHNRGNKTSKKIKKTTKHLESTTSTPTIDDFAMLTLYEQILAKTHEDNVMKMLTTNKKRKIDEIVRLSKRNPETLTDLSLKEDIKRMYDDGESIPDIDYNNNDVTVPEPANNYSSDSNIRTKAEEATESAPVEDTSYEGLSDKIAFKDYVNGYKSYLDFQKEQGSSNFSNLVKYQAHRHHKVDDIGKFILNKIPQVPSRKRRHFFDDSDMDEQDISTKSDDSWFKKHFYMFLDNGPPKKYHTSETVEFKDVTEARRVGYTTDSIERPGLKEISVVSENGGQSAEINLDELSQVLENCKKAAGMKSFKSDDNDDTTPESEQNKPEESGIAFKIYKPHIIDKFFGKNRRYPVEENEKYMESTLKYDDDGNFLFNSDFDRYRRNAKKQATTTEKEVNSISTQTTVLNKQDNVKTDKTKTFNKKDGFVSIVTQPTAVVNLFKTKVQESKIKKLLSKLHFHKRNKTKMKEKRHCTRVQRFNPLKKLKDMFLPRPDERVLPNAQQDYDMITSHIDTFKPVKYDKIPSIEELHNQVPNISGDFILNQSETVTNQDCEWTAKDEAKHNKMLTATDPSVATESYPILSSSRLLQSTQAKAKQSHTRFNFKDNFAVMDDIMNVKVKTLPKIEDIFTISPVTIDDIMNEINSIKIKLSVVNDLRNYPRTTPKYITQKKSYDTLNNDIDKESIDDIETILTRITNYYTTKSENKQEDEVNPVADNPKLYNFVDDYLNAYGELYPNQVSDKRTPFFKYTNKYRNNLITLNPLIGVTLKNLNNFKEAPFNSMKKNYDFIRRYKTYPDYFNDLVTWNSDILNNNKDLNPTWQDILRGIQSDQDFTTPNVRDMQNELHEMKTYLINNGISSIDRSEQAKLKEAAKLSPDLSSKFVTKTDEIKLAVNNHEMTKDPLDFGEDYNYVQSNELKKYSPVKSQDIIDVLNKLYSKKPNESNNGVNKLRAIRKPKINNGPKTKQDKKKFILHSFAPKKISKNSLKSPSSKNKLAQPIAKLNKQPKQYYNTPLPMKNEQFEKFLKENQLDVEYVTTPIVLLPTIAKTWHSRIKPLAKTKQDDMIIQNSKDKTTGHRNDIEEVIDQSYPEIQLEYLNDMEQDLLNDYKEINVRRKRSSMPDYAFTDDALIGKDKYEKFKTKIYNIFDKKPDISSDTMIYNTVSKPNEVEVTIIDFDEMDKKQGNDKLVTNPLRTLINVDPTIKDDTTLSNTNIQNLLVNLPKEKSQVNNRNLQIKNDESETDLINDAQVRYREGSEVRDEVTSMNLMQFPNELSEKCKDKNGNLPKRVQISSHSYKYDVLYNVPNMKSTEDVIEVTAPARNLKKKRFSDSKWKENINSEIEIIKIVDIVKAVDDYTRPDISFHINLPIYYAPNTDIEITEVRTIDKPSWTDLVLKYISGIALIEMLNKLGVLRGGPNFTEGLDVNFDRVKVFSTDGVKGESIKMPRVERAAKTTKKRYTYSQIIHFTREMKKTRNKRTFTLLPIIKEKLMLFAKYKNASSVKSIKAKELSTKSDNAIIDTASMATAKDTVATDDEKPTEGIEKGSKQSEYHYDNILIDYKGDLGAAKEENKKADETTVNPLFIITNKQMDNAKEKTKPIDNEGVYVEEVYDDQVYYEAGTKKNKAVTKTKPLRTLIDYTGSSEIDTDLNTNNKPKRDVNSETYTAKDVAALEIIVDLMKNPLTRGENEPVNIFSPNDFLAQVTKPSKMTNEKMDHITNSIQVHIAIPYDIPDKKRSADTLKLRKVFTAKLATPVDLEYQIHSISDNTATTGMKSESDYGFSPGMYLLVDNSNTVKGSFALKPVKAPSIRIRNADEGTNKVEDQTKADKAALSKEFVAAVNKHLIQLYENLTAANEGKTKMHNVTRREVSWDRVKKFFGHDRVCNCKCKANKTMCKACAASDEVINELSFEFDNLAKYINDHCTEIQTFFWMNPSGGKVLRDLVHKIDKSVNDYYKRVKGKCRGQTCKTFATYIDKRDFDNNKKVKTERSNIGETLIDDLKSMQDNFDISSNFIPYKGTLKEKGVELVNAASKCIASKPISKRSSKNEGKQHVKNVYSLDNISVNIICKPDSSTDTMNTSPMSYIDTPITQSENIFLDYDINKRNSMRNSLKELFVRKKKPKLDKLFTYYIKHVTTADNLNKREANYEQVESPLIADTGGSFWHDYLIKGNEVSNDNSKPKAGISVVQTNTEETPTTILDTIKVTESFKDKLIKLYSRKGQEMSTTDTSTEDSLSYNINELFKLFSTVTDVEVKNTFLDVENVKNKFTDPTTVTNRNVTKKHRTKKTKKNNKLHKTTKAKMHHSHKTKTKMTTDIPPTINNTTNTTIIGTTKLNGIKTTAEVSKSTKSTLFDYFPVEENSASLKEVTYTQTTPAHKSTPKKHFLNKIKMATLDFLTNIGKGNRVLDIKDLKSTKAENTDRPSRAHENSIRDFTMDIKKSSDADINVISEATRKMNPTILIIANEDNVTAKDFTKNKFNKYRSVLLSLLNYESSKFNKKKQSHKQEIIGKKRHNEAELVENVLQDDNQHSQIRIKMQTKQTTKAPDIDYDIIRGLKMIGSTPAPPGLKLEPGVFDWIANKIGIKVAPEEAVAKSLKSSTKHKKLKDRTKAKANSRSTNFEEADPYKTSNVFVDNLNLPSNDMKLLKNIKERKYVRLRRDKWKRGTNINIDNIKDRITKVKERQSEINRAFSRKSTVRSKKPVKRAEFDNYIRGDNGIYRIKRNGVDNEENMVRNVDQQAILYQVTVRKYDKLTGNKHANVELDDDMRHDVGPQRRIDKRSSNNDGIKNTSANNIIMLLQHTRIGNIMVIIASFYLVSAVFATIVTSVFRR